MEKHRFSAATIRASLSGCESRTASFPLPPEKPEGAPRFLMHAPHLIYGALSPETLQWAFSLGGSLGFSQSPVSAGISPSGGIGESYKRYEMMRIQGSLRTLVSPFGRDFDIEGGQLVWTLEENCLQRSGLPRVFTFVMLVQKPRADSRVMLMLDIDPQIKSSTFSFPQFWKGKHIYQPMLRQSVDFNLEVGQYFEPVEPGRGFNFATLKSTLEDYVNMPGRLYASRVSGVSFIHVGYSCLLTIGPTDTIARR